MRHRVLVAAALAVAVVLVPAAGRGALDDGANVQYGEPGKVVLRDVPVCRFVGRRAEVAAALANQPLWEPAWTPEAIEFSRVKPVPFDSAPGFELNREVRKAGAGHAADRARLLLDGRKGR